MQTFDSPTPPRNPSSTLKLGRLLIVDDETELMTALCDGLAQQGYETAGFTSGEDALKALKEQGFDLLLTDLMMPEMDGITLLKAGLEIDPHLTGIIMTGQGTIQTAVDAMKIGAFDYVLKPFKLNALLPILSRALEVRRLRMENVQLRETVAIYDLSKAIAFTLDLNVILNKLADAALQQCEADEVSIMLPTHEGDELYVVVVRGADRGYLLGRRVPIDRGIAGWVARYYEPLTLHGEVRDPRFAPVRPRPDICSSISMPMMVGGKLVGVLNVSATGSRRPFTLGQVKALNILTSTVAPALESAWLFTQVQEAEEKYRSIFENAVEGIFQTTPDGRFLTANHALARMLGYESPEELIATVTDIERQLYVEPEHRSEFERLLKECGIVQRFEYQVYRKDRDVVWISENARAVRDESGALLYYEGTVEDISKRKQAEEALKASQDYAKNLIDSSLDMIIAVDKDRKIIEFNRAAEETFGYGSEEVLGQHVDLLYADPQEGSVVHKTTVEQGRCVQEVLNRRKNDEVFPSLLSASVLRDARGEIVGVMGVSRDITKRKRAEEALKESEERLKSIVEHLPDGVCLLDGERRLKTANPSAQEYLKLLTEAEVGGMVSRLGEYSLEALLVRRSDGLPHEIEVKGPPRRIFEVEARPIRTRGNGWIMVVREVTQEREVLERVQQQDRLASVGQLAAGIAHDFNNLLTVMMGFAQLTEAHPDTPELIKRDLKTIYSQGQRAAQLVRQILDFSRRTVVERHPVNLAPFLKEAVKLLERTLPENILMVTDLGGEEYVVEANLTQLQQVITNLAVNARDAMPEGGALRIGLSRLRVEPGERLPLPWMGPGEWVVWTVSDTGTGMPPEVKEHIFEPFFTTKEPGQGTGLGLAQVYGIVKQHGGYIGVESAVGEGTTFTIFLPQTTRAEVSSRPSSEDVQKGQGETILVVEDQAEVLAVARAMLEGLNYRVFTAANGQEAQAVYEAHRDEIALVLTDMVMPDMSGMELFESLKEKDPDVRVVVMTGYPLRELRDIQQPQGILGWLEKPLALGQVAQVISAALKGERPV